MLMSRLMVKVNEQKILAIEGKRADELFREAFVKFTKRGCCFLL